MFTSVVGFHLNPQTCGVARFNVELGRRLGIPFVGVRDAWGAHPLVSLKWSELGIKDQVALYDRCEDQRGYTVFWHDEGDRDISNWALRAVWAYRDGFWCPPAPLPPPYPCSPLRLLTIGMAHKLHLEPYARLAALVPTQGYALRLSTAIHEGDTIAAAAERWEDLAAILGADRLQPLGCLSDTALAGELLAAHFVCAFFHGGVRSNNTSVWTAMMAGRPVITNLGPQSPPALQHGVTVFDIGRLETWPSARLAHGVAAAGQALASETFSWERFLEKLCES